MGRPDTWTAAELKDLHNNICPPTRTMTNARTKAARLGIPFCPMGTHRHGWSEQEIAELREGKIPEGRSFQACKHFAKEHGIPYREYLHEGRSWARWSDAEIEQVCQGYVPEGRTLGSTRAFAFQHGISFNKANALIKVWTAEEDALIKKGEIPANRTYSTCRARAAKLGFTFHHRSIIPNPRWKADGRAEAMWILHNKGFSMGVIGDWFSITRERVRQLISLYQNWYDMYGTADTPTDNN